MHRSAKAASAAHTIFCVGAIKTILVSLARATDTAVVTLAGRAACRGGFQTHPFDNVGSPDVLRIIGPATTIVVIYAPTKGGFKTRPYKHPDRDYASCPGSPTRFVSSGGTRRSRVRSACCHFLCGEDRSPSGIELLFG